MNPQDLLESASKLASFGRGRPKQAALRRSLSTAYYAMFHALARCCADSLIGGGNANRNGSAWRQVYRALDHGFARSQCQDQRVEAFPPSIQAFARLFADMQVKRHLADYDPFKQFAKSEVVLTIGQVRSVILLFQQVSIRERRAFAAFVLMRMRR